MSQHEDNHSGIPTRAIHEAYLDMQRALKEYRQARDAGSQAVINRAHGDVQETILTLYELLRPHIKHNDAVSEYWEGEPPTYPHQNGEVPDPEDGKGVLEVQRRNQSFEIPPEQAEEFAEAETLGEWHDLLDLNGSVRLTGIHAEDSVAFVAYDAYQLGMRELDGWETEYRSTTESLGGFLGGTREETQERQRVKIHKLKRAARELSDVAERLGALSQFDASTPRTEITDELIEDIDKWRKQNIET